jgi:hypothetical protein
MMLECTARAADEGAINEDWESRGIQAADNPQGQPICKCGGVRVSPSMRCCGPRGRENSVHTRVGIDA